VNKVTRPHAVGSINVLCGKDIDSIEQVDPCRTTGNA